MIEPGMGGSEGVAAVSASEVARALQRVRLRAPRVHCITNSVVQGFTANALLALGAVPSMTTSLEEIDAFAAGADALLINLGTLDPERREAIRLALGARSAEARPVVLDPVFADRSPARANYARTLIERGPPTILRANAAELHAVAGSPVREAAVRLATIIAQTGAVDTVTDGPRAVGIANGHPWMRLVTGMGCAGGALIAAFAAACEDPLEAAACGLVAAGIAGERAALASRGPGSFASAYLDALHALDTDAIEMGARLT